MSLADAVAKKRDQAVRLRRCKFGTLLDSMVGDDKEALTYALAMVRAEASKPQPQRVFTLTWLVETLQNNGYSIGKTVISDHLREVCPCEQASPGR